jgi:hypothetical protein
MKSLISIFGTKIKSLEILQLLNNSKDVVRQGFFEEELEKVSKFCKQNNLVLIKSKFKVLPSDFNKTFSNKGMKVKSDDPRFGFIFVYISKDELLAQKCAYFEIMNDHFNMGLTLNYPKCCSYFFARNFDVRSKLDNDYEIPVLQNSEKKEYPYFTNIFVREKDYCLINHFPCKLDCEKSIEIGKRNLNILKNNNQKLADEFKQNLTVKLSKHGRVVDFV